MPPRALGVHVCCTPLRASRLCLWEPRGTGGVEGGWHLRQDKLYIKENEGILHEVKLFPCAYRRSFSCSCP